MATIPIISSICHRSCAWWDLQSDISEKWWFGEGCCNQLRVSLSCLHLPLSCKSAKLYFADWSLTARSFFRKMFKIKLYNSLILYKLRWYIFSMIRDRAASGYRFVTKSSCWGINYLIESQIMFLRVAKLTDDKAPFYTARILEITTINFEKTPVY